VPLTGVLVRFRANYNPKGLQLDAEGGAQPHTGPIVPTFFGMLKTVYRIEGRAGFYKGLMPTLISTVVLTIFLISAFKSATVHRGSYSSPSAGPLGLLIYGIFMMMISLPSVIVTYRYVSYSHHLSLHWLFT